MSENKLSVSAKFLFLAAASGALFAIAGCKKKQAEAPQPKPAETAPAAANDLPESPAPEIPVAFPEATYAPEPAPAATAAPAPWYAPQSAAPAAEQPEKGARPVLARDSNGNPVPPPRPVIHGPDSH